MAETAAPALPVPEAPPPARTATFREVFADGEFRAIWLAEFASIAGDQFARVALTVIVYQRTHSPLLTALTYAASYLPWLIGGLLLADLADAYPRRDVMIAADLVRLVLVAAMALPHMPLWAMVVLLFVVTTLNAPFQGARSALRASILSGDRYALGLAMSQITREIGVVSGFVAGGFIVSALHARAADALLIDAATFAASAILLLAGVRRRPAPERARVSRLSEMTAGLRLVFAGSRLRTLMLLAWLAAFYTVAEAVAVPYAAQLRHGAGAAGLIFAAGPLGGAVGMVVFTRLVSPAARLRWMGPMAVATCLVLLGCLARPGLAVLLIILLVSGFLSSYQIAANVAFITAAPDARRGQAYALANAGMMLGQGLVYVLAGAAAIVAAPALVVAASGALGAAIAGYILLTWRRESPVIPERG